MQPYIFPYIGYFQLINYVDTFVLYDDVNYINRGYINRNYILHAGESKRFTLPIISASQNKKILELNFSDDIRKPLDFIRRAYSKAPEFPRIFKLVEDVFTSPDKSITTVCEKAMKSVFRYLNMEATLLRSSELSYDRTLSAADKLIAITKSLGASSYVNSAGGKALYDKEYFSDNHCELSFLEMKPFNYEQGHAEFVPNLSIIDILMWCEKRDVVRALNSFIIS